MRHSRRQVAAPELATIRSIVLVDGGHPIRPGAISQILGAASHNGLVHLSRRPVQGATDGGGYHTVGLEGASLCRWDIRVASRPT